MKLLAATHQVEHHNVEANLGGDLAYAVADSSVSGAGDDADVVNCGKNEI